MPPPPRRRAGRGLVALLLAAAPLAGCDGNDAVDDDVAAGRPPAIARILPAEEAIAGAQIPRLDPQGLMDAEIRATIGPGPLCGFHYARAGLPVLAVRAPPAGGAGVVKVNGNLVRLQPEAVAAEQAAAHRLAAAPLRITLVPVGPAGTGAWREADMIFEIGEALRVGYRGFVACRPEASAAGRPS